MTKEEKRRLELISKIANHDYKIVGESMILGRTSRIIFRSAETGQPYVIVDEHTRVFFQGVTSHPRMVE